jgi:hypothetical protein
VTILIAFSEVLSGLKNSHDLKDMGENRSEFTKTEKLLEIAIGILAVHSATKIHCVS